MVLTRGQTHRLKQELPNLIKSNLGRTIARFISTHSIAIVEVIAFLFYIKSAENAPLGLD